MYGYTANAYLDDFLIFGKSFAECSSAMHTLINLLRRLGFANNWSIVERPSQQLVFLGAVVDSVSMTLALPTLKLKGFSDLLTMFMKKKRVSVRQLETLVGKLSWDSQVVCGGSTFLRRVLNLKNSVKERHRKLLLRNLLRKECLNNYCSVPYNGVQKAIKWFLKIDNTFMTFSNSIRRLK